MRGHCFFITDDHTVTGEHFNEEFLFEAAREEMRGACTYDLEPSEQEAATGRLLQNFKEHGAAVGGDTVTFGDDFRSKYFASRFARFQALAARMTLDDFAEDRSMVQEGTKLRIHPIFEAQRLLCNEHGDYVWYDDVFIPLDDFIRQYAHSNLTFFVRRAVYLK